MHPAKPEAGARARPSTRWSRRRPRRGGLALTFINKSGIVSDLFGGVIKKILPI